MTGYQIRGKSLIPIIVLGLSLWVFGFSANTPSTPLESSDLAATDATVASFLELVFQSRDLDIFAHRSQATSGSLPATDTSLDLEALHTLADEYWYADDFEGLELAAEKLLASAKLKNDEDHIAIAQAYSAYATGGFGNFSTAAHQLQDVLARARHFHDKTAFVTATILLATLEPHEAKFHQAKAQIVGVSRLLAYADESDRLKPAISYSLGYLSVELGNIEEAIQYYTQCIEEARRAGERIDLGTVLYNTAMALSEGEHIEASNNLFLRLIEWYEETGQPHNQLYAYYGLAYNYYDLGEYAQSLIYANAGLEVFEDQNDFTVFLRQVGAIGAARTGDLETAREYSTIAKDYFDQRPEYSGTTWAIRNQHVDAEIAFAEKRYKEAYQLIKKYYNERTDIISEQNQEDVRNWRSQTEQAYQKIVSDQEAKLAQQSKIQILQAGLIFLGFFLFVILSAGFLRLKRTTNSLIESEARFGRAISNSKSGIWEYNLKSQSRYFSPSMEELFGYAANELISNADWMSIVFPPDSLNIITQKVRTDNDGCDHFDFDVLAIKRDQTEIWVNIEGAIVRDSRGRAEVVSGVTSDITSRKLAEHYLTEARNESDRLSRAKSEFIASMSHELRTPLNSVIGFSEVMQNDPRDSLSQRQMENLGYIEKAGKHLLDIVNSIINISRIELGECDLVFEQVDLVEVVDDCCSMVSPIAAESNVIINNLTLNFPNAFVQGDRQWIRQVLLNLLSNAIKYNIVGGQVSIDLSTEDPNYCQICISDTGIGIEKSKQPHIFELFNRLGVEAFSSASGSGIGLSVSKRMIEAMNGSIDFDSEVGVGSQFWIRLPLTDSAALPNPDIGTSAA
ncbi:MAG: PAS domain S-box protein [Alphaproteobacteria bacterium]|nr:MAG: PAS domain S-box protein [Alphaproteobacteria bacterium]